MHRKLHRLLILLSALVATPAALAQQTRLVPQGFPTVQSAINASATGDTVLVAPGTYPENLVLTGKSISLLSSGGAASTILDGGKTAPVLTISNTPDATTVISGFTLQHGLAVSSSHSAAGLYLTEAAATLSNNQFTNNSGDNVGVFFGSVSVLNSSLSTAPSTFGSGCDGGNGVTVSGATPIRNSAGDTVHIVISGNTIAGDSTSCSGTGISIATDSFTLPHLVANNIVRDSSLGLRLAVANGITLLQNLIFDNLQGGLVLSATTTPSTDPAQTFLINNTVRNNLNFPDPNDPTPAEIHLLGTAATTAFLNDILVGTTSNPVLLCESTTPTENDTPLLLDHTDVFNTTNAPSGLLAGDCSHGISNQLSTSGNLSADPLFVSSTNLHLSPGSPALDAGTNSAPQLPSTDLDGNPRILDSTNQGTATVDLGAYESQGPADSAPSTLTLTSSAYLTPATTITLTAVASSPSSSTAPSGTVTFLQNGTALSTVRADSTGTATLAVPLSTLGVYSFAATFAPDPASPTLAPTTSPVLFVDVTTSTTPATATTLSLSANPTTVTTAQTTLLTVHLASPTSPATVPPGSVTLADNGIPFTTVTPDPLSGQVTYLTNFSAAGTHTLTATYAGSAQYSPSFASTGIVVTSLLPTTLSLSASPPSPTDGQTVTLTTHLGSTTLAGSPGPVPPGALTLDDGSTLLTTLQPDASGTSTYTIPSSATSGAHTYTVRYAGTTVYGPASSSTSVTLPATLATTLRLTPSANPATLDVNTVFTASVSTGSSSNPTGSIRFTDGTTTLATVPLTSGQATYSSSALALGSHSLSATLLPDPGFAPSAATLTETVDGIPTLLSANSPTAVSGQPASLLVTASINSAQAFPIAPSGVVSISDGSTPLTTVALTPASSTTGTATATLTLATVGTHTLTLLFTSPSGDFLPSQTQATVTITAVPPISITLSNLTPSPTVGSPIAFSATVLSAGPLPTSSTLALLDGSTTLSTTPLSSAGGAIPLTLSSLTVGTHALSAVVRNSTGAVVSTSNLVSVTVAGIPSTLTLAAAPTPSAFASNPILLMASLASTSPPGHTPSGSVLFRDGSTTLGTAPLASNGSATLSTAAASPGIHSFSATYSGDNMLGPATAPAISETVLLNPTSTSLTVSTTSTTALQPVLYTAHVTSPSTSTPVDTSICSPGCAPSVVTFLSGSTVLGVSPVDPTGHATLTLAPHTGTLTVSAAFSGTPLFGPSASSSVATVVTAAPTTLTLVGSPNPLYQHESTTLTATLTAGIPPTATPLPLLSPITLTQGSTTLASFSASPASFTITPSTPGTLTFTATYPGSPDLAPASTSVTLTVLASDLSLSVRDAALTLPTTHHTSTSITLVASGAMSDTVDLTCPDAPFLVTCTFSPATTPICADGSAPGSPSITIPLAIDTDFILDWASLRRPSQSPALLALTLPTGLLCLLVLPRRRALHSRLPRLLPVLLLTVSALTLSSCSGRQPGHTPPGTYTLTLSAHTRNHNLTRTALLTLTVTP